MTQTLKLGAKKRTLTGRKVKQLRRQQVLPGNIYGREVKSLAIELPLKEFQQINREAGETTIINLTVDKETKTRPVLIHNIQLDPVTDELLHVDFHQVDLTKKVTVMIPLVFVGEAPAVAKGGVLVKLMSELEVEALPGDLPDKIEVDISGLNEVDDSIALKTVKIDASKVKLTAENLDELLVKIEAPTKEEEPVPAATTEAEGGAEAAPAEAETATDQAKAEGEKKAEAEKKPAGDQDKKPALKK